MDNQDTSKETPEKGTLDLDLLAKELDVDKKLLENSLTGNETREEALTKLAKKSANAQKEMSKTKQEKVDLEKQLENFVKETTKKSIEAEDGGKKEIEEETNTTETKIEKPAEDTSKIKEDIEKLRKELGIVQGEVEKTKTESRQMREEQVNQIRKEKVKNGFNWLMITFGEERAYELFNPINPKESPIGRILHPDTNKNAELYLTEDDPVKLATVKYLTDMGLSEDMSKALQSPTSLTETPGGNVPTEKGKEQEVGKLGKMIFGKK
jgi:hypothetical protein